MADLSMFYVLCCISALLQPTNDPTSQPTSFINESEFIDHLLLLERRAAPVAHSML